MKRRTLLASVLPAVLARGVFAQQAPVKVLATLAVQGAFVAIQQWLSPRAGVPVEIEFGPTLLFLDRLKNGEAADLAILTAEAVQQLAAEGRVQSHRDLVRSEVGIAVADDVPVPAMQTTDDFVTFMKSTPSIAYTKSGASGVHMAGVIETLGLAEVVGPKATLVTEGLTATLLGQGKVAAAVQQISELRLGGAKKIVPLPDAIQSHTVFTVAVLKGGAHADDAAKIVRLLTSADAAAAYVRSGVTPVFD